MKLALREALRGHGVHLHTDRSLPTGVDWLLDIARAGGLGDSPVCLDVGANVGQTVAQLRARFPRAQVHAFEPFAEPRRTLAARWGGVPGVTLVDRAMGAAPGRLCVRPQTESVRNSLRDSVAEGGESIEIDTLDRYCRQAGIGEVAILKTDTEGWDLDVLRGAAGLLAAGRVGFVYVEVTFLADNAANTPFVPVLELLSNLGYRMLGLYETYPLHHYTAPNLFCNALFGAPRVLRADAAAGR